MKSLLKYLYETKVYTTYSDKIKNSYYRNKDDADYLNKNSKYKKDSYNVSSKSKSKIEEVEDELKEIKTVDDKVIDDILYKLCYPLVENNVMLSNDKFASEYGMILYVKADNRFIQKGGWDNDIYKIALKYGNFLLNHNVNYKDIKSYYDKLKNEKDK